MSSAGPLASDVEVCIGALDETCRGLSDAIALPGADVLLSSVTLADLLVRRHAPEGG